MRTDDGQVFKLEDYRASDYLIPGMELAFNLSPNATRVTALMTVERNQGTPIDRPLVLNGDGLTLLLRIEIDGRMVEEVVQSIIETIEAPR